MGKGYPRTLVLHKTMMIQQFVFSGENKQKYTAQALELMVAEFFLISCAQLSYEHVFTE